MLKTSMIAIVLVTLVSLSAAGNFAAAASFTATTSGSYPPGPPGVYNPRAENGLLTVMSVATTHDWTISWACAQGTAECVQIQQGAAAAAAYGSDSSIDGVAHPRLLGYAVEPMADAMASARLDCFIRETNELIRCVLDLIQYANATATVNHRIVQRGLPGIPPEVQAILDAVTQVPVRLNYRLSATASNPSPEPSPSQASAGFSIRQEGTLLFSRTACSDPYILSCTAVGSDSGTWQTLLTRSTADRTVVYVISAGAGVRAHADDYAGTAGVEVSQAQAVADPYLHIDPEWEYARYFMVEQESVLHPGDWVEVTRAWQSDAMPPGFLCYKATTAPGTPKTDGIDVTLTDQFGSGGAEVKKVVTLCTPANAQAASDPDTHLKGYLMASGVKHTPQTHITVKNSLHSGGIQIDTIKPDRLLVPAAKSLTGSIDPPDPSSHDVDHLECYKVKVTPGTPTFPKGVQVLVTDQFTSPAKTLDVKKPIRLCNPVEKNEEGVKNPDTHLMCYLVAPAKGQPKHTRVSGAHVADQFGEERLDTVKEAEFCIPSQKIRGDGAP